MLKGNLQRQGLIFAIVMWLLSRLLIGVAMLLVAPSLPVPPSGIVPTFSWDVFSAWDSVFYEKIATSGYEYAPDSHKHSVAFFPLFPLLIRGVMALGLPVEVAGTLVNNLAFLGALIVLYRWMAERHGISVARWATAVIAWCPLSLFGTVIYSEGLFLLFSTAALKAFDQKHYAEVTVWGACATAARPTGVALIPAFLIVAWRANSGTRAYLASLATGGGLFLYSLYCKLQFGDYLAFLHAQQAWRPATGFNWLQWWKMLMQISVGTTNWKYGSIKDPWHPLLFLLIVSCSYILWRYRRHLSSAKTDYGFAFLGLCLWLLAGDPLTNVVAIFGGGYLLWHLRTQLSPVTVSYGFCALGLLLVSGSTISLNRLAYGIVSLEIALGMLLARYPRWGYTVMVFFAILLTSFAVRFAQKQWVA
ncbi:MAG: hypothetical protein JO235_18670 [Chroococcidiopsidaceae cyanobacterium CP_BM_RX_35]|nr:hypothetical protein [Chroococcidiopsidaceae cyanobacterium CP_BM_RX_35]